jgi:hypothetical protein
MPPGYVKTIRDEILYEYAKLISRSSLGEINYGFVTDRFKKLRSNEIHISDTIREWEREHDLPQECVFCGANDNLTTDHLVPKNRGGDNSADNLVLACSSCNSSRGDKGIFEWLGLVKKDDLHRLVAGKYLKQLLQIHQDEGTLDVSKDSLKSLCEKCPLPEVCSEWNSVNKLTCFCLESILPYKS